jgi:hypothetical protein
MGIGCIYPQFLDLGYIWRFVVSFTIRPLSPEEITPGIHRIGCWVGPRADLDNMEERDIFLSPEFNLSTI